MNQWYVHNLKLILIEKTDVSDYPIYEENKPGERLIQRDLQQSSLKSFNCTKLFIIFEHDVGRALGALANISTIYLSVKFVVTCHSI